MTVTEEIVRLEKEKAAYTKNMYKSLHSGDMLGAMEMDDKINDLTYEISCKMKKLKEMK